MSPQPRTKAEFAALYCPPYWSDSARRCWLNKEINSNPDLLAELQALGLAKNSKILTIGQQNAIVRYIGEP